MQTVLNNIAWPFIPSDASIAINSSFVQKHSSNIKSLQNIAIALNAIDRSSIQKHLASICSHPFTQHNSTAVIVTAISLTSKLSTSIWRTRSTNLMPSLRFLPLGCPTGCAKIVIETSRMRKALNSIGHLLSTSLSATSNASDTSSVRSDSHLLRHGFTI